MSEMVARVGREMLDAHSQWEKENNSYGGQQPWTGPHLELLARIAINAMREPTEAMLDAAAELDGSTVYDDNASAGAHWAAMIDAALS